MTCCGRRAASAVEFTADVSMVMVGARSRRRGFDCLEPSSSPLGFDILVISITQWCHRLNENNIKNSVHDNAQKSMSREKRQVQRFSWIWPGNSVMSEDKKEGLEAICWKQDPTDKASRANVIARSSWRDQYC